MIPRANTFATGHNDVADVLAMLANARPAWHDEAACRGTMRDGHSDWFPDPRREDVAKATARALAVCAVCPVRKQCAAAGFNQHGTWGEISRLQIRNARRAARARARRKANKANPC